MDTSEKDEYVAEQQHVKKVKQNQKRTGKSKEYLNKLKHVGCPAGRRHCCSLLHSKKSLNVKDKASQNKKINLIKDNCYNPQEFRQEIKDESAIKTTFADLDVVLLED